MPLDKKESERDALESRWAVQWCRSRNWDHDQWANWSSGKKISCDYVHFLEPAVLNAFPDAARSELRGVVTPIATSREVSAVFPAAPEEKSK
jgi:hypothetical protein